MIERVSAIIHSTASFMSMQAAHVLRSGGDVMRDAVAFDKAGSVLIAVVVVAGMFVLPRDRG